MFRRLPPYHGPPFRPAGPREHERGRALPVPGYHQTRNYSCGYACALMVARHFEADVIGQELFERLGTGRDGTRQNAIVRELRAHGVRANVRYDVDFDRLRTAIDRGKLIIGYMHDIDHWIVCCGYALEPERVYVADPRPGEPSEHRWALARINLRGFGIVCSAADEVAPEASRPQLDLDFGAR